MLRGPDDAGKWWEDGRRVTRRGRPVGSLADAELRENAVEDVVGGDFAGDGADVMGGVAKFEGDQFGAAVVRGEFGGPADRGTARRQRRTVACVETQRPSSG